MTSSILAKDNGETLAEHTIHCLKVSNVLLDNLPFTTDEIEKLREDLHLALAVHDVGKAATGFQKSLQKGAPLWGHRHEILSAAFASTLGLSEEIILAIITHHKSLPSDGITTQIYGCLHSEDIPWTTDITPKWSELIEEWNQNQSLFAEQWSRICNELKREDLKSFNKLSALSISKYWLRRGKQNKNIPFEKRHYASLLRGLLISSDHIASNNSIDPSFLPPNIPVLKGYQQSNSTEILQKQLRGFQKRSSEYSGNLILRAPTGSGKTLAALLWAQSNQRKNGRLFYALPNLASINSMYLRLCEYFGDDKNDEEAIVGLLHSRVVSSIYSMRETDSDLNSKLTSQRIARTINSLAREMWFPIRVCTPHQILRYTLQGKGWDAMLSEFPNSCFIFDEIHAYDPTVTGLTVATAKFLINQDASCLFLSATMPAFLRTILESELQAITFLEPDPSDESDRQILDLKRHTLEIVDGDLLSNIETIVKEIEKAKSTLIVCNHVPSAQLMYDEIKKRITTDNVLLLHSRFCRRDRNEIEQRLRKSLPKVLVSTQVVEVSLDIDFEKGFFEPAPIDALIQRLGRVNRFGKNSATTVKVVVLTNQLHAYNIYDPKIVENSLNKLEALANPISEQELVDAADLVYSQGYSEKNQTLYEQGLNHPRIRKFQENLIAGIYQEWVNEVIRESNATEDMLPASLVREYEQLDTTGLKIEANNLLVPVPLRITHFMKKSINMNSDPWVINMPYSKEKGLTLQVEVGE